MKITGKMQILFWNGKNYENTEDFWKGHPVGALLVKVIKYN